MKKILLIILMLVIATAFFACTDNQKPSVSPEKTTSAATATATATATAGTETGESTEPSVTTAPPTGTPEPGPWDAFDIGAGWTEEDDGEMYADGTGQLAIMLTYDNVSVKSVTADVLFESATDEAFPDGNFGIGFVTPSEQLYLFNVQITRMLTRIQYYNQLNAAGDTLFSTDAGTVTDGKWHSFKVTVSDTTLELYIDGQLIGSASGTYAGVFDDVTVRLQAYNCMMAFKNLVIENK